LKAVAAVELQTSVRVGTEARAFHRISLVQKLNTAAVAHLWVTTEANQNMELHLVEEEFLKPKIQIRKVMARQTGVVVVVAIMDLQAVALVVLVL
jgi:hypothetical protein